MLLCSRYSNTILQGDRRSDVCSSVFFFQAEDGIRDLTVTGVQTCALPISGAANGRDGVVGELLRQVDARDLGAESPGDGMHADRRHAVIICSRATRRPSQ